MHESLARHVSAQLRAELARREITSRAFAAMLGVNEMWVSRRIRGRQPISLDELERIAALLDLPIRYFTERDPQRGRVGAA